MERIFRQGTIFVDESGREVRLNGVNIPLKGEKKRGGTVYRFHSVTEQSIAGLHAQGINLVRLILTWDGVEPRPGEYDEGYLDHYRQIVSWCEKYEIYFILDMHQDLYSSRIGDGAPPWASLTDGYPIQKPVAIWAEGYFYSRAVAHCFENFWNNTPVAGRGLQDRFADMWQHVIRIFAQSPALLGFDFMNEPFPGLDGNRIFVILINGLMDRLGGGRELPFDAKRYLNREDRRAGFIEMMAQIAKRVRRAGPGRLRAICKDPAALREILLRAEPLVRKFDQERYSPFLCRMAAAARAVTDRGILFMENGYYSNIGIPCSVQIPTVDGLPEEQVAFAPHAYDIFIDSPLYRYASNARAGLFFGEHRRTQERLGVPVIVGEWGGFSSHYGYRPHAQFLLRLFEENGWSRCYWYWDPKHFDRHPIREMICRSYPQAVCGKIRTLKAEDRVLDLTYQQARRYEQLNRIYLSGPVRSLTLNDQPVPPDQYWFTPCGGAGGLLTFSSPPGENRLRIAVP